MLVWARGVKSASRQNSLDFEHTTVSRKTRKGWPAQIRTRKCHGFVWPQLEFKPRAEFHFGSRRPSHFYSIHFVFNDSNVLPHLEIKAL